MKIAFFTPTVTTSAIGRVSSLVVEQLLKQGDDVIVIRSESPEYFNNKIHPFECEVILWNDVSKVDTIIANCELITYQIGNHFPYHEGCIEWMPKQSGISCCHDVFFGHLFWSWADKVGRDTAHQILSSLYGESISQHFFKHSSIESFLAFACDSAPLSEWIAGMSSGVIVHSSWAMDRITSRCAGPVEVVPLPYDAPHLHAAPRNTTAGVPQRTTILTIGHVNGNKRYESIIRAIGDSPILQQQAIFRIVGSIHQEMKERLQALADQQGVSIVVTGEVDDFILAAEIHQADIMCCLRYPALEAASASTIEAMLYRKPVIVTDTGFFRDLPNDCVVKVSPANELADLRTTLEALHGNSSQRQQLAAQAQCYAEATFRADSYAERIVALAGKIERTRFIKDQATRFANQLKQWGATGDEAIVAALSSKLDIFR